MKKLIYVSALDKGILTIGIGGRLDSDNAHELAAYCHAVCEQAHEGLVLDLAELKYISSAGLRLLLTLLKKETKPVEAIGVGAAIYEIMEMTGFTHMLKLSRARRSVSIEGLEKIGQGGQGSVYRLDKDSIIKVFNPGMPLEEVEKERNFAQQAFVRGVPTAIAYDVVDIGYRRNSSRDESRGESLGVVYELLNADTVAAAIIREPEKLESYVRSYARTIKAAHAVDLSGTALPDVKAMRMGGFEMAKSSGLLSERQADVCLKIYGLVPERTTFIHGDANPNNVMIQGEDMLLIDMGAAGFGHPAIDIAGIYMSTGYMGKAGVSLGDVIEGMSNALSVEQSVRLWEIFAREYFGITDENGINALVEQCEIIMLLQIALIAAYGGSMGLADDLVQMSKATCDAYITDDIEERIALLNLNSVLWGGTGAAIKAPESVAGAKKKNPLAWMTGKSKKSADTGKLSVDSKIKDIMESEAAKAILERHIPGITTDKQLKMAYGMSLRAIQKFPQAGITPEQIEGIEGELAAL